MTFMITNVGYYVVTYILNDNNMTHHPFHDNIILAFIILL